MGDVGSGGGGGSSPNGGIHLIISWSKSRQFRSRYVASHVPGHHY